MALNEAKEPLTTTQISELISKRSFIKSLPDVECKPDAMSEEAYFYGFRVVYEFHFLNFTGEICNKKICEMSKSLKISL